MSKLYLGSLDLAKIDKSDIVTTDKDGKPFKSGGKFLNISIWLNDEPDKFGNHISVKAGKKDKSYYIGNAKEYQPAQGAKASTPTADQDDLPF